MIEKSRVGETTASETSTEYFCSNLSLGLHAVAQPLTIVRASLVKSYTNRMTREELQELTGTLAFEVERVCALFSCLQQLVHIESTKPHLSALPILPLLTYAAEGVDLIYNKSDMLLSSVLPDSCETIVANRERTIEALSGILLIAHSLSHSKETVELIVSPSLKTVRVVVQNVNTQVSALNAQASLNLAVAGANIRSLGATLSWSFQPFRVEMDFQKASSRPHEL